MNVLLFLKKRQKRSLARMIRACFKEVNWSKQSFMFNDIQVKDSNDNKVFYPVKEIDKGINKLNKLTRRLSK